MNRFTTHRMKFVLSIAIGILLGSLASCSTTTNRDIAEKAVETFHAQFNSELFETIELSAAPEFKGVGGSGKAYLQKVHEMLGRVTSSKQATGSVQNMAGEAQINLVYMSDFANSQAAETFVFRVKDKRARLVFYEVGFRDPNEQLIR
jgi:hypothetical protein